MDTNRFKLSGPNSALANSNVVVGNAFAFLDSNALKARELSWLAKLLGHKPGTAHIVSIAGPEPVDLFGVTIEPMSLERFFLQSIVSDKNLYRQDRDVTNLLVLSPLKPNSSVVVSLACNGCVVSKHEVELGVNGEGSLKLRDLNVGDYQLCFDDQTEPACEFVVAEYRLVPLVASLTSSEASASDLLTVVLHLESFGVPVNGEVRLNLMDRQTQIATVTASAAEGVLHATFQLQGSGPHTIAVQLVAETSKTATVPLRGSRETERKNTIFSPLGNEVVGSLLPISSGTPVRGIYLKEGGLRVSPIVIEKVDDDRARFTANAEVTMVKVVVADPTFPTKKPGAVDVSSVPHPQIDQVYKEAEANFKNGKMAEACKSFESRRSEFENPHPYYAYWMACCYARAGQVDKAVNALRQSIVDGWTDFAHMENDEDLASLKDYKPYQKLLSGGRTEVSFSNLSAGDKFEVEVAAPVSLLLIGALVDGKPWEGWASVVTPTTVSAKVTVAEHCTPGERVTIRFDAETAGASIYAIVKDARLISADTPELKLAAAIKNFIEASGRNLTVGAPNKILKDIFNNSKRYSLDSSEGWGMSGGYDAGVSRALGSRSAVDQMFSQAAAQAPGSMNFASRAPSQPMFQPQPQQQEWANEPWGSPAPAPAGASGQPTGGAASNSSPYRAYDLSPPAGELALAQSIRRKVSATSPENWLAKTTPAAVIDDPEVLYAGLVTIKKGTGSVKIKLPDTFSNYIVECFVISGMNWASKETHFTAVKESFAQLTTPVFATQAEPGFGFVHVGSSKAAKLRVLLDGAPVALYDENGSFDGQLSGPQTTYTFVAGPGLYETILEQEDVVVARHQKRVDEPGKLKRVVRSLRVLTPGESIALHDDASLVGLQVLPGLENDFSLLLDATADYSHCCCEQTAAKILSGCVIYLNSNGDDSRKKQGESIIIAGIKREQSMWLKGQGFRSYPHMPANADNYYGPKAARYLWNLELLQSNGNGDSISADLKAAIASGLEMAQDTTQAYNLSWPPKSIVTSEEAYNALRFDPNSSPEASLNIAREIGENSDKVKVDSNLGRQVGGRTEQSYAAATLLKAGAGNDLKLALKLANIVISQFNAQGRLYSTVDSVAAIALMTELNAAGITKGGGKLEVNGTVIGSEEATVAAETIKSLKVLDGVATIAVDRTVEEDWKKYEAGVPLRISLEKDGEHSRAFTAGDTVDLIVTLEEGYKMGDLLWVALPDAFSRVVGGGQVKLFSLDFAGANELRVSLAATGTTEAMDHTLKQQSLAVCVRNMFNEERAGNPGQIKISVKR